MKATYLLFCCCFFYTNFLQAQATVTGYVVNQSTQEPLANAKVELLNHNPMISSFTDEAGRFTLANVPEGKHRLFIELEDYELMVHSFETHQTQQIKIGLEAIITNLSNTIEQRWNTKITTVSQSAERLINAPATVHIVTAQDIQERGYTTLAEILEDIPEIEIQHKADGLYSNFITVRGVQGTERFLVLLDGMRINSMATTRHAIDKNYWIRSAERVEVVLGPSSAVYGADAFTGVINIISKNGAKEQAVEVESGYGLFQTIENSFFAGFGNEQLSFNLNGGYYQSREPNLSKFYPEEYSWFTNQYSTQGNLLVSPFNQDTTQAAIAPFDMSRRAYFIHGTLKTKQLEIGGAHNAQVHSSAMGNNPAYSPPIQAANYGFSISNIYLKHQLKDKVNKKWSLSSSINGNAYILNNNSRFINSFSNYEEAFKYGFNGNIKVNELFNWQLHRNHSLTAALSYQYTYALPKTSDLPFRYTSFEPATNQGLYYIGTNVEDVDGNDLTIPQNFYLFDQHYGGAMVQYKGNFNNILLLTLGARFDYSSSKLRQATESQNYYDFNPRLGLVVRPAEFFRIKLFYGEAFLAPSPEKRFEHYGSFDVVEDNNGAVTGLQGGFWHLPNPDLEPEKMRSAEFSLSYIKETFALSADAYYNSISNLVGVGLTFGDDFLGIPIAVAERSMNNSNAYTYGGSFKAQLQQHFNADHSIRLNVYASYSLSEGAINDSLPLPFSARHTLKGGLTFVYKKFSLHTRAIYRTATVNVGGTGNAPFLVLNAFANCRVYESLQKRFALDVFVRVQNVLDNRYYNTTLNSGILLEQVPQDPFRFTAGLRVRFAKN